MPPLRRSLLLLLLCFVASSHLLALCLCSALSPLPDPAPLDPALVFPSATPAQPGAATIPAFPEQSDAAAGNTSSSSSACPLAPSPALVPAVLSSCNAGAGDTLPPRLRCCPALAAWLFAAYAPAALAQRPPARSAAAAAVEMPVPPDDSEACAGAADRALRAAGAALPRPPPGANGTCDVAFCYCGVRLRRLACGSPPADGGQWAPAEAAARRLEMDCALPGASGCSKCFRALTMVKAGAAAAGKQAGGGGRDDCELMGLMWLLQRNPTRYGGAAAAVIQALMAADEASAGAGAAATGPGACSLPADGGGDMPLAAEYARLFNEAGALPGAAAYLSRLTLLSVSIAVFLL